MIKVYGSMLCPDCVACVAAMKERNLDFEFYDFKDSLKFLKEFLRLRDTSELFNEIRENDKIGIPCIVKEDGSILLDWMECLESM